MRANVLLIDPLRVGKSHIGTALAVNVQCLPLLGYYIHHTISPIKNRLKTANS